MGKCIPAYAKVLNVSPIEFHSRSRERDVEVSYVLRIILHHEDIVRSLCLISANSSIEYDLLAGDIFLMNNEDSYHGTYILSLLT